MNGVVINMLDGNDSLLYSSPPKGKLVGEPEAPSSPPLTLKVIQMSSGRRKQYKSKNDPEVKRLSERRISARVDIKEDEPVKSKTMKLIPESLEKSNGRTEISSIPQPQPNADGLISLNVGPLPQPPPENPQYVVQSQTRQKSAEFEKAITSRRRDESPIVSIDQDTSDQSPRAERRKSIEPSGPSSRTRRKKTKKKKQSSGNVHTEVYSEINTENPVSSRRGDLAREIGITVTKKSSSDKPREKSKRVVKKRSKTKPRPMSPHRIAGDRPKVILGGRNVTSRDMIDDESSSASTSASSTEGSSRRNMKSRQEALSKTLKDTYDEGDFYREDEENLKQAVKAALDASRQHSVSEAIAAGEDLNAEVLKSLTRPNAIHEVVEQLVSQRRERIKDAKRKAKKNKPISKPLSSHRVSSRPPTKTKSKIKQLKKNVESIPILDDDDSEIEVAKVADSENIDSSEAVEKKEKKPSTRKPKIVVDDGSPKTKLPGSPLEGFDGSSNPVEDDVNVKLPRENRPKKKSEYERPDEIGQQDHIYDPLGVDVPFGDEDISIGDDDEYEESSEDDSKLTIAEKKDEMLYRFRLIKETYPGIALPRITKRMKLAKMVRLYEHVMSRVKLKVKVTNYQIFLIIGFLAMQYGGKKLIGIDTSGFTMNQMHSIKLYESYLREMGESDWSSSIGVSFPVYVRLPFFMCVNMGIFVISKWIFKKTGKDYTAQFHKLYGQLTGGDDYVYLKDETGSAGLGAGGDDEDGGGGGGGIFGILKSVMGMFGGMGGGGGGDEPRPKRGTAGGPNYRRKPKKAE